MVAESPSEICRLFQKYMAQGDIESVLELYEPEVVFMNQAGGAKRGIEELREELAPLAAAKATFEFKIRQLIQAGDIALTHTEWNLSMPKQLSLYAIEVARRQSDGTWRWLIGDPFTVGRKVGTTTLS
jgi:ketosteroid isomerase-like protein